MITANQRLTQMFRRPMTVLVSAIIIVSPVFGIQSSADFAKVFKASRDAAHETVLSVSVGNNADIEAVMDSDIDNSDELRRSLAEFDFDTIADDFVYISSAQTRAYRHFDDNSEFDFYINSDYLRRSLAGVGPQSQLPSDHLIELSQFSVALGCAPELESGDGCGFYAKESEISQLNLGYDWEELRNDPTLFPDYRKRLLFVPSTGVAESCDEDHDPNCDYLVDLSIVVPHQSGTLPTIFGSDEVSPGCVSHDQCGVYLDRDDVIRRLAIGRNTIANAAKRTVKRITSKIPKPVKKKLKKKTRGVMEKLEDAKRFGRNVKESVFK